MFDLINKKIKPTKEQDKQNFDTQMLQKKVILQQQQIKNLGGN